MILRKELLTSSSFSPPQTITHIIKKYERYPGIYSPFFMFPCIPLWLLKIYFILEKLQNKKETWDPGNFS